MPAQSTMTNAVEQEAQAAGAAGESRTALISIGAAGVLVALKLGTGIVAGSLGLVSAGIESSGDVVAAVLTFFAIRFAVRPVDRDHPYGHRRAENLGALGEAAILIGGGLFIVVEGVVRLPRAAMSWMQGGMCSPSSASRCWSTRRESPCRCGAPGSTNPPRCDRTPSISLETWLGRWPSSLGWLAWPRGSRTGTPSPRFWSPASSSPPPAG